MNVQPGTARGARVQAPHSLVRFGHARADITPPVGIYHGFWGAARHDRATGVHRPLYADVLALAPADQPSGPPGLVQIHADLAGLVRSQHQALTQAVAEACALDQSQVVITYSHSHAAGWFVPDRKALPGGELIGPYLESLAMRLQAAARQASDALAPATITYATGRCQMATNRDHYDAVSGSYVCGYAPEASTDETLLVARVTAEAGDVRATLVHYACHPTTLAWENTLLSPDFPGALRETVERATGAPCIFAQAACGDRGPRRGFTGDPAVADHNGMQVGHATLAVLAGMGPPQTDFVYQGPVVSGATLGVWADEPFSDQRRRQATAFAGSTQTVDLPLKTLPAAEALQRELEEWQARQRAADAAGDVQTARDSGARAERARRWLSRLSELPDNTTYPLQVAVYRLGDAIWVSTGGEPYSTIQQELRHRFPHRTIFYSPLFGDLQVAYLLPRDRYGLGLYQEEPSILAPGCLEQLTDAVAARIQALET